MHEVVKGLCHRNERLVEAGKVRRISDERLEISQFARSLYNHRLKVRKLGIDPPGRREDAVIHLPS